MARKPKKITVTDVTTDNDFKDLVVVHFSNGTFLVFVPYIHYHDGLVHIQNIIVKQKGSDRTLINIGVHHVGGDISLHLKIYDNRISLADIVTLLSLTKVYLETNAQPEISWREIILENLGRIIPLLEIQGEPRSREEWFIE